jgi:hypothetical protein
MQVVDMVMQISLRTEVHHSANTTAPSNPFPSVRATN